MSVHIMKKGVDKRFVDAVVVSEYYCPPGEYDFGNDNQIYIKKNTNRLHPSQQAVNSRFIIYSTADWYIQNTENWLGEYLLAIINLAHREGYKSVAFPSDLRTGITTSVAEICHILSAWLPDDIRAYIMVDEEYSFLPLDKVAFLDSYINNKYVASSYTYENTETTYRYENKSSLGINNWFEDNSENTANEDDDYLNDVISILKRNSAKSDIQEPAKKQAFKQTFARKVPLEEYISIKEDGFSETLLRLIEEKGMDPVVCYKRANVNRRTFSKIRTDKTYHPSKKTVFAFAISLKLTYEETERLLKSAGYTFTNSSKMDIIVEYYILNGVYDIFEINEALYEFDQPLLGV